MSELTIKPLTQMPKIKAKVTKKENVRKLLEKFDSENWKIAEIPITEGHKARGLKISIGRILAKDHRTDIETFESADGKSIVLKRK
jgi:hypothetical protein